MQYYLETENGFKIWTGQTVNGIVHNKSITADWTPEELAAIGIYLPVEPPIPEGFHAASFTVERIDGVVQYVYALETDEPVTP